MTAPKRPAPKRPAPKCPRAQTAAPKRRRPNAGAQKSSLMTDVGTLTLSLILRIRATFRIFIIPCSLTEMLISSSDSDRGTPLITFWTYLPLCRVTSRGSVTLILYSHISVRPSRRVLFGLFSGPPNCTRTYVDDGAGTSADSGPNNLFSSALTFTALTLVKGIPKNSMKSRSSAERPILGWMAEGPLGLGAAIEAPGLDRTAAVVGALGMYRRSSALRLGPGAVCVPRFTSALRAFTGIFDSKAPGGAVFLKSSVEDWGFIFFFFFFCLSRAGAGKKPSSLLSLSSIGSTPLAQKPLALHSLVSGDESLPLVSLLAEVIARRSFSMPATGCPGRADPVATRPSPELISSRRASII